MRVKDGWLIAGILAAIGIPFIGVGVLTAIVLPQAAISRASEVEKLAPATIATLKPPLDEVLVLGVIEDRAAPAVAGLMIYQERQRTYEDGQSKWVLRRSHTPEFWMRLPEGLIKIAGNYQLAKTHHETAVGDRRYSGFQAGDAVLVLGRSIGQADPPTVEATVVSADTPDSYAVSLRSDARFGRLFGSIFLVTGIPLTLASAIVLWRGQRRRLA